MFATSGIRLTRRHRTGYPQNLFRSGNLLPFASLGASKKPYSKGIVLTAVSSLIMIVGIIMTVFGFTDVFGAGITMMGMLMIALSVLLFLYAVRMFLLGAKQRENERNLQVAVGAVTSPGTEREDNGGTLTVVIDTHNLEARSEDDVRPPDYSEVASDFYPDFSSGIDLDTVKNQIPSYAPPSYDQAVCDKNENATDDIEKQRINREQKYATCNGNERTDGEPVLYLSGGGYQDLPTVTI